MRKFLCALMAVLIVLMCAGCTSGPKGETLGADKPEDEAIKITFNADFYDNAGDLWLSATGSTFNIEPNKVKEYTYSTEGYWEYNWTMSSVMSVYIDGKQIDSCGSTIIFADNRLEILDMNIPEVINTHIRTNDAYVDISSDVSYVYGRRHTYIGQPVHGGTSVTTTIKGNTINENSTTSNKTTNTNNETVTGNSTTNVTGSTNLTTGSLNITSGSTNLDLNKTHIHTTNELCIKSSTNTYFKGATNTYLGKDQEGNKGTNFYVTSSNTGDLTSPNISLNASTKYNENVGNKSFTATGTLNEDITGVVTTTNRNNCNIYTYGNSYTYVHGNIIDTTEGERLVVTKGGNSIHRIFE